MHYETIKEDIDRTKYMISLGTFVAVVVVTLLGAGIASNMLDNPVEALMGTSTFILLGAMVYGVFWSAYLIVARSMINQGYLTIRSRWEKLQLCVVSTVINLLAPLAVAILIGYAGAVILLQAFRKRQMQ